MANAKLTNRVTSAKLFQVFIVFPREHGGRASFLRRKILLYFRYFLAEWRQCDIVGLPGTSRCPPRHKSRNKIPAGGLRFVPLGTTSRRAARALAGESEGKGMK